MLNTWEFFLFYFATFGVHFVPGRALPKGAAPPDPPRPTLSVWESLSGWADKAIGAVGLQKKDEDDRDERIAESHVYCYMLEEYMRFFVFKSFEEDLSNSKVSLTFLNNDYYNSVSSEYGVLSSSMLEVLLECFLHITDLNSPSEYQIPSDLIIEGLTITIKALLRGLRSVRTLEYGPPAVSHSVRGKSGGFFKTTQEELFQALLQTTVRNRLYLFLLRAFEYAYWPSSTLRLLRYIIEIWGMMIRPWNLSAPSWMPETPSSLSSSNGASGDASEATIQGNDTSGSGQNSSQHQSSTAPLANLVSGFTKRLGKQMNNILARRGRDQASDAHQGGSGNNSGEGGSGGDNFQRLAASVELARRDYVLQNFIFYGPAFIEFLHMAQRYNLAQKKELKVVIFGLRSWTYHDILEMALEIESAIRRTKDAHREGTPIPYNIERMAEDAKAVLHSLDPKFQLQPIHGPHAIDIAHRLVSKMELYSNQAGQSPSMVYLLREGISMAREIFGLSEKAQPVAFDLKDSGIDVLSTSRGKGFNGSNTRGAGGEQKIGPFRNSSSSAGTGGYGRENYREQQPSRLSMRRTARRTNVEAVRDMQFLGDESLRPITSTENAFLTRKAFALSRIIKQFTGLDLDLRILGSYRLALLLAFLAFVGLLLIGFGALLQSDFTSYDYGSYNNYNYDEYDYEYSMRQAAAGRYR